MITDVHPMLDLSIWEDLTPDPSILIIDGPSPRMYVTGGTRDPRTRKITGQSLRIIDGPRRDDARDRIIHDTDKTVRHIVILSAHGTPSIDAIRWLAGMGITWAIIDNTPAAGKTVNVLATSVKDLDAKMMRKQAMAYPGTRDKATKTLSGELPLAWTGVQIIRELTSLKLEGQAWNAESFLDNPGLAKIIRQQIDDVMTVRHDHPRATVESILAYEGTGADAYWTAWKGTKPVWHRITTVLKPQWLAYPGRKSLRRSETNKQATDPINAALNLGYHVAESWAIIMLLAAGLDPRMGIQHVDQAGRASFALDVIETVRPYVDQIVYQIFTTGRIPGIKGERLDPRMFVSTREGIVKCAQPLTGAIAQLVTLRCQEHLTPVIERVRDLLDSANVV